MSHDLLFSLWFFMPAGLANMTPIFAAQLPGLRNFQTPMDWGKYFRGKRIFGDHKTWRGLICGLIVGTLVVWLQSGLVDHSAWLRHVSSPVVYRGTAIWSLGLLLSFGALFGDALESFFKRQWNIDSGQRWFPFDQLDYVLGGLIFVSFYIRLPLTDYLLIILIWFGMHLLFSYLGYLLKLKDKPI